MSLAYSPRTARAIGYLKSPVSDIEVFVEDASRIAVWTALVRRCLPIGTRLTSVTPLGGRHDVIEACRLDQTGDRARLYIVDGDWDFLLGRGLPRLSYLYRIPAMNLEGLVYRSAGVRSLISDLNPAVDSTAAEVQLRDHVECAWGPVLRKVFAFYAEHYRAGGGCATAGYHVRRLIAGNGSPWKVSISRCKDKMREIRAEFARLGWRAAPSLAVIKKRMAYLPAEKVISGKTYLWPLLENWLKRRHGINFSSDHLMLLILAKGPCPALGLRRKLKSVL